MSIVQATAFIAFALLGQADSDEAEVAQLFGQAFGKKYIVTVTDAAIQNTPDWDDDAENPPVSAKKAMKLATVMKDSLVKDSDKFKWEMRSLSLMEIKDKWLWVAHLQAMENGPLSSEPVAASEGHKDPHYLSLVVLMDGSVIKPVIEVVDE